MLCWSSIKLRKSRGGRVTSNPGFRRRGIVRDCVLTRAHWAHVPPPLELGTGQMEEQRIDPRAPSCDATMTLSPIDKLRCPVGDNEKWERNIYSPSWTLSVRSILSSPFYYPSHLLWRRVPYLIKIVWDPFGEASLPWRWGERSQWVFFYCFVRARGLRWSTDIIWGGG